MGMNGLNALLSISGIETYIDHPPPDDLARQFDFAYIATMNEGLENMYGTRGGRGMALRIGRASFTQGMKGFGAFAGMGTQTFKALPIEEQVPLGLRVLSTIYTKFSDQDTTLKDQRDVYQLIIPNSPMVWGRNTDRPACHMMVGIIQESIHWTANGHEFHVQEMECRATGNDQCVFKINKNPIGQS